MAAATAGANEAITVAMFPLKLELALRVVEPAGVIAAFESRGLLVVEVPLNVVPVPAVISPCARQYLIVQQLSNTVVSVVAIDEMEVPELVVEASGTPDCLAPV